MQIVLDYEAQHKIISDKVLVLNSSYSEITDLLEEVLTQFNEKANGTDSSGENGVVRVKDAIRKLKIEISEMCVTAGMLSAELLRLKQSILIRKHKRELKKRKQRIVLHGIKAISTSFGGDDDSDNSQL